MIEMRSIMVMWIARSLSNLNGRQDARVRPLPVLLALAGSVAGCQCQCWASVGLDASLVFKLPGSNCQPECRGSRPGLVARGRARSRASRQWQHRHGRPAVDPTRSGPGRQARAPSLAGGAEAAARPAAPGPEARRSDCPKSADTGESPRLAHKGAHDSSGVRTYARVHGSA